MLSIVARSMACRSSLWSGRFERAREADAITRSNMRMRAANLATAGVSIPSRWSRRKSAQLQVRLREPDQSPRYTLRVFDDASQCAGNSDQPFDPGVGRINQRAGTGAADSARRTERIDRAAPGRSRRSISSSISIPRQIARAASVNASPSGWPIACSAKPRAIVRAMAVN